LVPWALPKAVAEAAPLALALSEKAETLKS
jgi:hypothetical protein